MNKFNRFAAAAAAFALASTAYGCSSPEAITFGKGTQTAITIDGYDVPAGVFVYNEIYAYNSAAYELYMKNGSYPTLDDVKNANIESVSSSDWIQNKAIEYCRDFVANEREFEKIGAQFSPEDVLEIEETLANNGSSALFNENGVGEESLRKIIENNYKQYYIFEHYYGLDAEKGCSEDELKEYYTDNNVRVKYFTVSMVDSDGEELSDSEKRKLNNLIDGYVREINAEKDDLKKMHKLSECEEKYNEYVRERDADDEEEAETTTTAASEETTTTTTTTTTSPYDGEFIVTKYTTTEADDSDETTTTTAAEDDYTKSLKKYNDYLFNELGVYKAEKYQYDEKTIYVVIKGDIVDRMTDDDLWSEDSVESLLAQRYYSDFEKMMKRLSESYEAEKNSAAFRKYSPFKLNLENM